ncbi:hypothetical protein ACFLWR_03520 [Chloroflexota bacterium]
MKCTLCSKDFGENQTNFDRHMGSKEHLSRLYEKPSAVPIAQVNGEVGGGGTTTLHAGGVAIAPQTKYIQGIGDVVQKPDGNFVTMDALQLSQQYIPAAIPAQPVPWKKYAVIGGVALTLTAAFWMASNNKHRSDTAPGTALTPMPMKIPGGIDMPPVLLSLMSIFFVSKMARNEFKSWIKLISDWAK